MALAPQDTPQALFCPVPVMLTQAAGSQAVSSEESPAEGQHDGGRFVA